MVRRTKFRALGGSRMYNEAIRGRQNGNPGYNPYRLHSSLGYVRGGPHRLDS